MPTAHRAVRSTSRADPIQNPKSKIQNSHVRLSALGSQPPPALFPLVTWLVATAVLTGPAFGADKDAIGNSHANPAWMHFAPTGQMRERRFAEHTATLLQDGSVLVTGGWDGTRGSTRLKAAAEIFDPQTLQWTATPNMSHPRTGHTATLLKSGQVLIVGGPDSEIFDPATRQWSSAGQLAQPRSRHTATLLDDGRVAIVGGFIADGIVTDRVELYDPATGKWVDGGQLREPRAYHTAYRLSENHVLLAGGENPRNTSTAEIYDANTKLSRPTAALDKPHAFCQAWTPLKDGRLLVSGGEGVDVIWPPRRGTPPEHLASVELYDPATETWTTAAPMSRVRCGHSATLLEDGSVFVMGGEGNAGKTSEFFDATTGKWSPGPSLAQARWGHTATLLRDGRILVVGGNRSDVVPFIATRNSGNKAEE